MSVLLPDATLGLRRRVDDVVLNAHGERVPGGWGALVGPGLVAGRAKENADGTWALALEPALWPVRQGDMVISQDGRAWTVTTAAMLTYSYHPDVDWVRVTALQITNGGTQPGGAWFVARFLDSVDPEIPDGSGEPIYSEPGLWTGHGPPPSTNFGANEGDEYLDLDTGVLYRLGED